jgi:hypothetical protein
MQTLQTRIRVPTALLLPRSNVADAKLEGGSLILLHRYQISESRIAIAPERLTLESGVQGDL